jgi:hypothetical protein
MIFAKNVVPLLYMVIASNYLNTPQSPLLLLIVNNEIYRIGARKSAFYLSFSAH